MGNKKWEVELGAVRVDCQSIFGLASSLNLGQVSDAACVSAVLLSHFCKAKPSRWETRVLLGTSNQQVKYKSNETASPVDKQLCWLKGNYATQSVHICSSIVQDFYNTMLKSSNSFMDFTSTAKTLTICLFMSTISIQCSRLWRYSTYKMSMSGRLVFVRSKILKLYLLCISEIHC